MPASRRRDTHRFDQVSVQFAVPDSLVWALGSGRMNYAFRVMPKFGDPLTLVLMSWLPPTIVCIGLVIASATAWVAARAPSKIRDLAVIPLRRDVPDRRTSP